MTPPYDSSDSEQNPSNPLRRGPGSPGETPDGADAPYVLDRLAVLTHEMANLLDGSLRTLELARRAMNRSDASEADELSEALRRIETVQTSLGRMADLVAASMKPAVSTIGSSLLGPRSPITLSEAIGHAVEVIRPRAEDGNVSLSVALDDDAGALEAGPIYPIVLNGLHNALEAVLSAPSSSSKEPHDAAGSIEVRARRVSGAAFGESDRVVIEIIDDGVGLPAEAPAVRLFEHGYTTKPDGMGIGLALSRSIVLELGGVIELLPRPERTGQPRPGAVLRTVYRPPSGRHAPMGRAEP